MNKKSVILLLSALLIGSGSAYAAEGKVVILSPADGATVDSYYSFKLKYEAEPGPNGDHLHLNIDGKRVDIIRQLKGNVEVGPLPVGKHEVCLAVNTKAHVPTGVEKCISVTSQ